MIGVSNIIINETIKIQHLNQLPQPEITPVQEEHSKKRHNGLSK